MVFSMLVKLEELMWLSIKAVSFLFGFGFFGGGRDQEISIDKIIVMS